MARWGFWSARWRPWLAKFFDSPSFFLRLPPLGLLPSSCSCCRLLELLFGYLLGGFTLVPLTLERGANMPSSSLVSLCRPSQHWFRWVSRWWLLTQPSTSALPPPVVPSAGPSNPASAVFFLTPSVYSSRCYALKDRTPPVLLFEVLRVDLSTGCWQLSLRSPWIEHCSPRIAWIELALSA